MVQSFRPRSESNYYFSKIATFSRQTSKTDGRPEFATGPEMGYLEIETLIFHKVSLLVVLRSVFARSGFENSRELQLVTAPHVI